MILIIKYKTIWGISSCKIRQIARSFDAFHIVISVKSRHEIIDVELGLGMKHVMGDMN